MEIITPREALRICKSWSEIATDRPRLMNALSGSGFSAWKPYMEWLESYCQPADVVTHRALLEEQARISLGRPFPFNLNPEDAAQLYSSPLITALREARDGANGVPQEMISTAYPNPMESGWRREIDPCMRAAYRHKAADWLAFENRWTHATELMRDLRGREARRGGGPSGLRVAGADQEALAKDLMTSAGRWAPARSKRLFLEFRARIDDRWELSLHLPDRKDFLLAPSRGFYDPELRVQLQGAAPRRPGQFLIFNYSRVLIPGFYGAYREFRSLDELDTNIRAHLRLIELLYDDIKKPLAAS